MNIIALVPPLEQKYFVKLELGFWQDIGTDPISNFRMDYNFFASTYNFRIDWC